MALTNVRIPVEVSFVSFHDDDFPAAAALEYNKEAAASTPNAARGTGGAGSGGKSTTPFTLTTGSFPQEIILTTRSSFADLKRIELTLDEAKDIVVERCVALGEGGGLNSARMTGGGGGAEPMSAKFEVVGERQLVRGEAVSRGGGGGAAALAPSKDDDLKPRRKQVEVLQLDPAGAGKGIRAIKLRILSGYSDFVAVLGIELYGKESEQRIAVLESKAEMTSILDPQQPVEPMQKVMAFASDSALSTALMSVCGGYVLGAGFSLFGSMISTEVSANSMGTADFFRHSLRGASKMGGSFAYFALLFGGIEVALEKRRGRKDHWNPTLSGGFIGGAYGWRSYKYPGLTGGFIAGAAASLLFERLLSKMGLAQH